MNDNDIDSIIGPIFGRWEYSTNKFIYHKTVFNRKKLIGLLKSQGFISIEDWDPLIFFGSDETSFDDYSKAFFPHMDFKNGTQISLNIVAKANN